MALTPVWLSQVVSTTFAPLSHLPQQGPAATAYTINGPSSGTVGEQSTNFTVTPDGTYNNTITITPSGGGLTNPIVLTFSPSSAPQTFSITPTQEGLVTLTPTNNGSLSNPGPAYYTVTASTTGLTVYPDPFRATTTWLGN